MSRAAALALLALLATQPLPACPERPRVPWPEATAPRFRGVRELSQLPSRAATPQCGAPLALAAALPDPSAVPDRDGEWLVVANAGVEDLDLDGWTLQAGRRRHTLPATVLPAGATYRLWARAAVGLGNLRLRNGAGAVTLSDPCGVTVSRLAWGGAGCQSAAPGQVVVAPGRWPAPDAIGPARVIPGGADGGCGQT